MSPLATEPIPDHWTFPESTGADRPAATIADVTSRLALLDVHDIDAALVPLLAAAAAEVAFATGIPWSRSGDDPPVALLRLIAKVAIRNPTAGGPHTDLLLSHLT